jgi:hypothetical protein
MFKGNFSINNTEPSGSVSEEWVVLSYCPDGQLGICEFLKIPHLKHTYAGYVLQCL